MTGYTRTLIKDFKCLECSVCLQDYALPSRVPQVLNCGHTFCSSCLEQVANAGKFRCPTCREESSATEIRVNFALRDALVGKESPSTVAAARIIEAEAIDPPTEDEEAVTLRMAATGAEDEMLISIVPPLGSVRTPSDICCVVDVSTSMAAEAMLADGAGVSVSHGLALIDIVKHALRTVIHLLNGRDRLALVAYSNTASVILELTPMTKEGQQRAELRLHQLLPDGMTNIWAGLEAGIQLLAAASDGMRLQHLLLLTDGIPNINPPRGIVPMLKRLKEKSGGRLPCSVNTFGFGYELDSELLHELARLGSASYAFIPDAGFVGTVFVNAVTNLLVTMGANPVLKLTASGGISLSPCAVPGGLAIKQAAGGLQVDLSGLQFGQSRHVLLRPSVTSDAHSAISLTLEYDTRSRARRSVSLSCMLRDLLPAEEGIAQKSRVLLVDGVRMAMSTLKQTQLDKLKEVPLPLPKAQEQIAELESSIRALGGSSEAVEALLEDLSGQVAEAFSREEWYTRWGVHFLPSLLCAHASQQCNNFKDPGVQHYGGDLFADLRDQADEVFCSLEAPKPQLRSPPPPPPVQMEATPTSPPVRPAGAVRTAPLVDMSRYYDASAG